jgi:hypothetical protein
VKQTKEAREYARADARRFFSALYRATFETATIPDADGYCSLVFVKNGERFLLSAMCDPEGNGPGALILQREDGKPVAQMGGL